MDSLDCALDLMRRLPPKNVEKNLESLLKLAPELEEDLLSAVDQPLKTAICKKTQKPYLLCDYNRDGDSYRSPWSNEFYPLSSDGPEPSAKLRKIEIAANDAFDAYRDLYFDGGVSSVYAWDLDEGFAAVVLIKKENDQSHKVQGGWDSIHVFEILTAKSRSAHYKLTSTVMLHMDAGIKSSGMNLSGSLTRQAEQDCPVEGDPNAHVSNMGRMVEDMELKLRNSITDIYFGKTRDIVNDLRSLGNLSDADKMAGIQSEVVRGLLSERK